MTTRERTIVIRKLIIKGLIILLFVLVIICYRDISQSPAESALSTIGEVKNLSPDSLLVKSLDKKKKLEYYIGIVSQRNVFKPVPKTKVQDVFTSLSKWNIKLLGIIFDPACPAAFISNEGKEGVYYIGDTIVARGGSSSAGRTKWQIKSILRDKVILVDPDGNERTLELSGFSSLAGSEVSSQADPPSTDSPPPLLELNEIIGEEEIVDNLKPILKSLSREVLLERIKEFTDISPEEIPPDTDLTEYVADLIRISQDRVLDNNEQFAGAALFFSTRVNPDNSPQNPGTVFTEQGKRIYACFSNENELKGLKSVIMRWSEVVDARVRILHVSTKPINSTAEWNYVWMEMKEGWSKGVYQVEILNTGQVKKIAQGRFDIE